MGSSIKKERRRLQRIAKAEQLEWERANPPEPPETMFVCLRIYPNGEIKVEPRFERDKDEWIEHNHKWRPGCALFLEGEYLAPEGHTNAHEWTYEYKDEIEAHTDEARERLTAKPIPNDWHLDEGRYYAPGDKFYSTGSYMMDEIADKEHGPFKF